MSIKLARSYVRIAQFALENSGDNNLVLLLQDALQSEFQQWDLYFAYKGELQGLERDSIKSHFEEHATEEAEHIEILQRYLVTMGEQPTKKRKPIPSLEQDASIEEIIKLQLKFELEAVQSYQNLLEHLEDNTPLKIEIENILATEMEHAQDLRLLLRR